MSEVSIAAGKVQLAGELLLPSMATLGVVLFSHGSGSGRHSPRNQYVARELRGAGIGTLLLDLLTVEEERRYENRFDIALLTERLGQAVRFVAGQAATRRLPVGLFGASTGAASALRVAAATPDTVRAVVSRGGRPDLAGEAALKGVQAPTLLLVGGEDHGVIELNETALDLMSCPREMVLVPGATHLFEEPGTLEEVARLAAEWFTQWMSSSSTPRRKVAAA
ncbi:MAG TPA: dienelactone hydrolase family protein [Burkholderiales bacterium]|nr:dienelactone hydrolase family protein [Burkholderiales bacterium]